MVVYMYNPVTQEAEVGGSQVQVPRVRLDCVSKKSNNPSSSLLQSKACGPYFYDPGRIQRQACAYSVT